MLKKFLRIAVPVIITCNFIFLILVINIIFAGRLNDVAKLAGVGLGTTIDHILCLAILFGLNGALETLVSQAFGSGNIHLCGIYLNRARIINTMAFIPLMIVLICSE